MLIQILQRSFPARLHLAASSASRCNSPVFFDGCPVCRLYGHQVAWSRRRAATRFKAVSDAKRAEKGPSLLRTLELHHCMHYIHTWCASRTAYLITNGSYLNGTQHPNSIAQKKQKAPITKSPNQTKQKTKQTKTKQNQNQKKESRKLTISHIAQYH